MMVFCHLLALSRNAGVGVANLIDLGDATSPCGAVHIRNKTMVGERLAAAALALAYVATLSLFRFELAFSPPYMLAESLVYVCMYTFGTRLR